MIETVTTMMRELGAVNPWALLALTVLLLFGGVFGIFFVALPLLKDSGRRLRGERRS